MAREPINQYEVTFPKAWRRSRVELPLGKGGGTGLVFDRNVTNPAHPYCGKKTLSLTATQARSLERDGWGMDPKPPAEVIVPVKEKVRHVIPLTIQEARAEAKEAKAEAKEAKAEAAADAKVTKKAGG